MNNIYRLTKAQIIWHSAFINQSSKTTVIKHLHFQANLSSFFAPLPDWDTAQYLRYEAPTGPPDIVSGRFLNGQTDRSAKRAVFVSISPAERGGAVRGPSLGGSPRRGRLGERCPDGRQPLQPEPYPPSAAAEIDPHESDVGVPGRQAHAWDTYIGSWGPLATVQTAWRTEGLMSSLFTRHQMKAMALPEWRKCQVASVIGADMILRVLSNGESEAL